MNESSTQPNTCQFSPRTTLAAIGLKLRQLDLWGPVREQVKIDQKVVKDTPVQKLYGGPLQATLSSHLHTQGLRLQFGPTGNFLSGGDQSLVYLSYQYNVPAPCPLSTSTTDGRLQTVGGSLTVAGNRVRISSDILVAQRPTDVAVLNCPPPIGTQELTPNHWWIVFYHMHEDLVGPVLHSFNFRNWRYTGGEHFGEAIYVRSETGEELTFDTTTYLIMIHTPQP